MELDIIVEVWKMVRESIISSDRYSVAENLVTILIDSDFSPVEIKSAFRGDGDVIEALKYHVDHEFGDTDDEESYEEDSGYDDDEEEW